jgi:putative transposase
MEAKFGGLEVSEARRLRIVEAENARLKKLLAGRGTGRCDAERCCSKKW